MAKKSAEKSEAREWSGSPDLEPFLVPIGSLHRDPANARKHGERNLASIKASLGRFGQQRPILIDSKQVIRAGNGTHEAATELGWSHIAAVRSDLQGSEATAYAIADNRTAELAEWDDTALAETLRALQSEEFDLAAVGYDDGEVDAMIEQLAGEIVGDDEPEPAGEDAMLEKFEIVVECRNESHQRETFEALQELGHSCRVLTF